MDIDNGREELGRGQTGEDRECRQKSAGAQPATLLTTKLENPQRELAGVGYTGVS